MTEPQLKEVGSLPSIVRVTGRRLVSFTLLAPALLVALLTTVGPLRMDPVAAWSGASIGYHPGWLPGFVTIDPNIGITSFALGSRAALDLLSGKLPLWNHYEGLGTPLLGEMQSAALFPPTWLLLLPYGQAIEHALLQAVAGCGTYVFLRRFGLGTAAALTGGLLFEFNGVFAWLRNAVYNPVAFLPWLFYTIESLFCLERVDQSSLERLRLICLGAIVAALALYAGFPEVVYFYSMLLAGWAGLRAVTLPLRRALAFLASLLGVAALALLISAPLLIAFAQFLREAAVGGHHGVEFRDHVLPPQAFLVAVLPYVFGPIFAAPQASVSAVWGEIGGYIGVVPLLLAMSGVVCSWRCAATWLLTLWVVLAVGASHGVPILHGALSALPLVTIAAYSRYLDASWIFACVVLGAVFIDRVETMKAADRCRVVMVASVVVVVILGIGLLFASSVLSEIAKTGLEQLVPVMLSLVAGAGLLTLFHLSVRVRWTTKACAWLAVLEAVTWFMLPFASTPSFAGVDRVLINFLRDHAALERFAIVSGSGLGPNFGSIFSISSMNYNDLPVPARTAQFVTSRLDSTNGGLIFGHNAPPASEAELQALRSGFAAALPGYAQAGVRYVLSTDNFNAGPAYPLASGSPVPVPLRAGQVATIDIDGLTSEHTIGAVSILIGTYYGAADGSLRVGLCQGPRCTAGTAPLVGARDNGKLLVTLEVPMPVSPGMPVRLTIAKDGGKHDVALWMQAATLDSGARLSGVPAPAVSLPSIEWIEATNPMPILRTPTTTVFEMTNFRPYASAPGCRLEVVSHDHVKAHCAARSRLLRLEVFLEGWVARVNGANTPIDPIEDTFQSVELPAGDSVVDFRYAPWGLRPSIPIALGALALCLAVLGRPYWFQQTKLR